MKVVKVPNQRLDARHYRKGFQHVLSYEISQIADRLHGDGLIEQVQGLLVVYAKSAPKGRSVGRKGIMHFNIRHRPQALSQRVDVGAKSSEVLSDVEESIGHHVEAVRLTVKFLE